MTFQRPLSGVVLFGMCAAAVVTAAICRAATSEPGGVPETPAAITAPDAIAGLPPYLPKAPVEGELKIAGSSAMSEMAQHWALGLKSLHPNTKLTVTTFSSGQVLARLASGEMQVGLMSRPLTAKEIKDNGVIAIAAAKDVIGIVAHPDTPIDALTLAQGVALLRDPKATDHPGARTWGELGVGGDWKDKPITLYGREEGAGAWGYLVNRFLGEGATGRTTVECAGYAEICDKVAKNPGSMGYVSLSLATPTNAKVLSLALTTGETIPAPRTGEPMDPRYPLVRELYIVVKKSPDGKMSPLTEEFLRYVLSRSGQEDVVKSGFLPIRRDEILASRDQLGWTGKR